MPVKVFASIFSFVLISFCGYAQECTLDIGGENTDMLKSVFQLNDDQINQMEAWSINLKLETESVEDSIQKLFEEHPQSSTEELTMLADKYRVLQQQLVAASRTADKNLLSILNKKQYDRYLTLCYDAIREPIKVVPTPQKDSLIDPE